MNSDLRSARYLLLTTFRRDGTPVATPVWVVHDGRHLYAWSNTEAGKVKRLRRDSAARVAPCTFRGRPTGAEVPATATLAEPADTAKVVRLLRRKYWLLAPFVTLRSNPEAGRTVAIRIIPSG